MGARLRSFHLGKESSMENSRGWLCFFLVMALVFATGAAAWFIKPTEGVRLALLAWQQLLFVAGGLLGSKGEHLKPANLKTAMQGLVSGVGLYLVNVLVGALAFAVAAQFLGSETARGFVLEDRATVQMLVTSKKPFIALGATLLVLVGAPLGEELFFRGLLMELLRERMGVKRAVFLAALLFALLHFYTLQFVPVLISGMVLGLLLIRSGSILVPITAHFTVNALGLLALLASL